MPSELAQFLADATRPQESKQHPSQAKAAEIQSLYKQGLQQLRGTRNMHPEARRVEIAKLYANTQAAMRKLKRDQAEADNKRYAQLERQLWGYDDVRTLAADRASVDQTIRDAQDRAAKLKAPGDALRALDTAELSGDHVLARAIFKRAHDLDWDAVTDAYLSTRPTANEQYQEAGAIYHRYNTTAARMQDGLQYGVHKPDELSGLKDAEIQSMADPGDAAA